MEAFLPVLLIIAVLSALLWRKHRRIRNGDWHYVYVGSDLVARRSVQGKWVSRPLTEEELKDFERQDAW
jgi:hypothetical protein